MILNCVSLHPNTKMHWDETIPTDVGLIWHFGKGQTSQPSADFSFWCTQNEMACQMIVPLTFREIQDMWFSMNIFFTLLDSNFIMKKPAIRCDVGPLGERPIDCFRITNVKTRRVCVCIGVLRHMQRYFSYTVFQLGQNRRALRPSCPPWRPSCPPLCPSALPCALLAPLMPQLMSSSMAVSGTTIY